jgi:hypothetical protein
MQLAAGVLQARALLELLQAFAPTLQLFGQRRPGQRQARRRDHGHRFLAEQLPAQPGQHRGVLETAGAEGLHAPLENLQLMLDLLGVGLAIAHQRALRTLVEALVEHAGERHVQTPGQVLPTHTDQLVHQQVAPADV